MKLGQEVWVHGYIDEMRKDIAIIKNEGGYFGAVYDEITDKVGQYVIINGVKYIAEKPMVKTVDKLGEVVISGFREDK